MNAMYNVKKNLRRCEEEIIVETRRFSPASINKRKNFLRKVMFLLTKWIVSQKEKGFLKSCPAVSVHMEMGLRVVEGEGWREVCI
jgi:hypothetical protein